MNLKQAKVLITGGSRGIGLGLAARFINAGSEVIITCRNADKLNEAQKLFPGLKIFVNDIGKTIERENLEGYIREHMPGVNVVINNAGIQRRIALAEDKAAWEERQEEIDILLSAPIHLNHLLIPLVLNHGNQSLIVNVTSGGAYIPQVFAPVYSACKAAMHSYTMILRQALSGTNCRIAELIPPAVQTKLAGPGQTHGVLTADFCDAVFEKLTTTEDQQIGFGRTADLIRQLNGRSLTELFKEGLVRFPVAEYVKMG